MKRFLPFLIAPIVAFSIPFLQATATPVLDVRNCTAVEGRLTEPLDTHTEVRLKKYLSRSAFPKTFSNMEELQRWCSLWEENEKTKVVSRESRLDFRMRTLLQRFYKEEGDSEATGTIAEAPETDLELEDLAPNRQARVQSRINRRNCEAGGTTDEALEEYAICLKELKKVIDQATDTIEGRRMVRQIVRTERHLTSAQKDARVKGGDYSKGSASEETQSIDQKETNAIQFDPAGPGSEPLQESLENKIGEYVNRGDCLRVTPPEAKVRCQWLVQKNIVGRQGVGGRAESKLRSLGILNGTTIRRGIMQDVYRERIDTSQSIVRTRRLQGFRPSPRTVKELQENYQTPIVVPGDCQVDPKLCNQ